MSEVITYRFRIKDKHRRKLNRQAALVNQVWNFCNETQKKAVSDKRKWLNYYDLHGLTTGATKEGLDLHAQTIQQICKEYDKSRKQHKKPFLRWRKSKGTNRSLGWVPFNGQAVKFRDGKFIFRKQVYDVFLHRQLPKDTRIGCGSFSEDSRGRWYINVSVEVAEPTQAINKTVGIDLGLKDLATLSDGRKIEVPQFYRRSEERLGKAQRANKKKQVRAIHAKIKNQRKDFLHKQSSKLVNEYGLIVVGDVSPSKLAKTNMAKSVNDAGWYQFKSMLSWKQRLRGGGMCLEVSEKYSSQTCSECGCLPASRPKGIAGLGIREWTCDDCGYHHDRDVNAAKNILRVGLHTLVAGSPRL